MGSHVILYVPIVCAYTLYCTYLLFASAPSIANVLQDSYYILTIYNRKFSSMRSLAIMKFSSMRSLASNSQPNVTAQTIAQTQTQMTKRKRLRLIAGERGQKHQRLAVLPVHCCHSLAGWCPRGVWPSGVYLFPFMITVCVYIWFACVCMRVCVFSFVCVGVCVHARVCGNDICDLA
jgi:hypothetical protein